MPESPLDVVLAFIAAINAADDIALRAHMTEDHTFIDAKQSSFSGASRMLLNWQHFFHAYPAYHIAIHHSFTEGNRVALFGEATGGWRINGEVLPGTWSTSAAWLAEVDATQVSKWIVFCDTSWIAPPAELTPGIPS